MRLAGLILGILGGLSGIGGGLVAAFFGGLGQAFQADGATTITSLGLFATLVGVLGLVGGVLSMAKPKVAGTLMIISAIVGLILVSAAYALAFVLLILAAVFAFMGNKEIKKLQS